MENFNFYSPTEFVFGKDRENEVGALVRKHGGSRVLLHFGGGSAERSGLLDRVRASLRAEGVYFTELGGTTGAYPRTVVLDINGKITFTIDGKIEKAELADEIDRALLKK